MTLTDAVKATVPAGWLCLCRGPSVVNRPWLLGSLELPSGPLMYAGPSGIDTVSGDQYCRAQDRGSGCGSPGYGSGGGCPGNGNHCYRSGGCSWLSGSSRVVDLVTSGVAIGSRGWMHSRCSGRGAGYGSGDHGCSCGSGIGSGGGGSGYGTGNGSSRVGVLGCMSICLDAVESWSGRAIDSWTWSGDGRSAQLKSGRDDGSGALTSLASKSRLPRLEEWRSVAEACNRGSTLYERVTGCRSCDCRVGSGSDVWGAAEGAACSLPPDLSHRDPNIEEICSKLVLMLASTFDISAG